MRKGGAKSNTLAAKGLGPSKKYIKRSQLEHSHWRYWHIDPKTAIKPSGLPMQQEEKKNETEISVLVTIHAKDKLLTVFAIAKRRLATYTERDIYVRRTMGRGSHSFSASWPQASGGKILIPNVVAAAVTPHETHAHRPWNTLDLRNSIHATARAGFDSTIQDPGAKAPQRIQFLQGARDRASGSRDAVRQA